MIQRNPAVRLKQGRMQEVFRRIQEKFKEVYPPLGHPRYACIRSGNDLNCASHYLFIKPIDFQQERPHIIFDLHTGTSCEVGMLGCYEIIYHQGWFYRVDYGLTSIIRFSFDMSGEIESELFAGHETIRGDNLGSALDSRFDSIDRISSGKIAGEPVIFGCDFCNERVVAIYTERPGCPVVLVYDAIYAFQTIYLKEGELLIRTEEGILLLNIESNITTVIDSSSQWIHPDYVNKTYYCSSSLYPYHHFLTRKDGFPILLEEYGFMDVAEHKIHLIYNGYLFFSMGDQLQIIPLPDTPWTPVSHFAFPAKKRLAIREVLMAVDERLPVCLRDTLFEFMAQSYYKDASARPGARSATSSRPGARSATSAHSYLFSL